MHVQVYPLRPPPLLQDPPFIQGCLAHGSPREGDPRGARQPQLGFTLAVTPTKLEVLVATSVGWFKASLSRES